MAGRVYSLTLVALLMVASFVTMAAGETEKSPSINEGASGPLLGIMPLANYAGRMDAYSAMESGISSRLEAAGIPYLSATDLRPLLRQHRIRGVGQVGAEGATVIRDETGVGYLLLGSIDFYDDQTLEVGLSLRILETSTLRLIKATSVAAAAEDYTSFFDLGRATNIDEITERVLDDAFEKLGHPLLTPGEAISPGAKHVAIVPFENQSEIPQANGIIANILLSNLLASGYVSLEPGFVNEAFLLRQTMARGEIDLQTLQYLHDTFAVDVAITGVVDFMQPARGDLTVTVPSLTLGARLIEADGGHLRAAWDISKDGNEGEWLLGLGRTHSLGQLASKATRDLVRQLDRELDDSPPEGEDLGE